MTKPRATAFYNAVMAFLVRFPLIPKLFVRPWLRLPFLARRTPLVIRALLGESSFTMHEYLPHRGRIAIGGVDETIWCSRIFHVLKRRLAEELGGEKRDELILSVAREMGEFEADTALKSGRWVPKAFRGLLVDPGLIGLVKSDAEFRKLFTVTMTLAIRLILDEGGWGHVKSFDVSSDPILIRMEHLQEPLHSGPSDTPVCTYMRGYLAGFLSRLLHVEAAVEETSCAALGEEECVFAVRLDPR